MYNQNVSKKPKPHCKSVSYDRITTSTDPHPNLTITLL